MVTPLIERLRRVRISSCAPGNAELCEEAAREIERLSAKVGSLLCEIDYLRGPQPASAWENDT